MSAVRRTVDTPEQYLEKAIAAKSPLSRGRYARQGLALRAPIDHTTQAMLLRQLYLAHFEGGKFALAQKVALQAIELRVLPDILHQDVARAALASGDLEEALGHLRMAARSSPASRRPFHLWTLGSTFFLAQRYEEAIAVLERATRWGTHDKPLYRGHLALVLIASGMIVADLQETIDALARAPCGQGYGRFILGHLAYAAGEWAIAHRYLDAFVKRTSESRPALAIALAGELQMAKATLAKIDGN